MFRRKEETIEENETKVAVASTENKEKEVMKETAEIKPTVAATPAAPAPVRPAMPASVAPMAAQPAAYRPSAPAARPAAPAAASNADTGKRRILTVGNDILLKGEIATCDRLVIEGAVDAKLNDVHTVEIAETGSFKGSAEIEDAEISGLFEGDLVVRNRLVIYSTGRVRGKITYGEIEIERGGELTGEIKSNNSPLADAKKDKTKAA